MLVVLTGDDLCVLLSACSILQALPSTRLLLVLPPQRQHNQHPWTITQLPMTKQSAALSNAGLQRSASSIMFLDSVQQVKYQERPDSLLVRASPSFSKMMMYHPQALRQYLIQVIQSHGPQCSIVAMKGELHQERLMGDLEKSREPYHLLDLSSLDSSKSRYSLSQVHWMGMDDDLRLPRRAKVDPYGSVFFKHVGIQNGVKLATVGSAGQLQMAVEMGDHVVELVQQRMVEEMRWARL